MLIRVLLLTLLCLPVKAIDIKLGYGRISLVDLGALINAKPVIVNENLVRAYELSGLDDEDDKTLIALQGLADNGETDLTLSTSAGIYQFHIVLNDNQGEDFIAYPQLSRIKVMSQIYKLSTNRSSIIALPKHINEYVLAGNINLLSLKQIKDYYDKDFLKTFSINTNTNQGETDLVMATRDGVYKITVEIKGDKNAEHNNIIDLR